MQLLLLASNPKLYSNQKLVSSALSLGHNISFINVADCYLTIQNNKLEVYHQNQLLDTADCVITRIKPAITYYATSIIRQFEASNIVCINSSTSINNSRNKLYTLQILAQHNLPVPTTAFANSALYTKNLVQKVQQAPLIIKLIEGTKGVGVMLAETNKAAESIINSFHSLKNDALVQQYICEAKGQDIRCFVVGEKVIATMQRTAQEGEFRANIHLGASAKTIKITPYEEEMAIKATKLLGLQIAGVDMIRSNEGLKILEVNSSPGLEGIEKATKIDIGKEIISHIVSVIKKS